MPRLQELAAQAIKKGDSISYRPEDIAPPVLAPRKILGIGLNYADHARETGRDPPKVQTWFVKQVTALNAPYGEIARPVVSGALDYEAELVVVIGKRGRHVPAERAHEIIAGYTCGNDVSVRDWQKATPTMIMGKGFDTHAPVGPWIVTPDEIGDVNSLALRAYFNGELMQDGNTSELIHKIPDLIAHLTAAFTLEPGDLIFTGTPAGVGVARSPQRFMQVGDKVRIEIDRIGHIEHTITAEREGPQIG
ncbi:MAG: fumarylacetoacetate hydrolase [Ponticaulis sp.]|nr:fumarylacetoacetate hydrolase [Ponticaulis sp.]